MRHDDPADRRLSRLDPQSIYTRFFGFRKELPQGPAEPHRPHRPGAAMLAGNGPMLVVFKRCRLPMQMRRSGEELQLTLELGAVQPE